MFTEFWLSYSDRHSVNFIPCVHMCRLHHHRLAFIEPVLFVNLRNGKTKTILVKIPLMYFCFITLDLSETSVPEIFANISALLR